MKIQKDSLSCTRRNPRISPQITKNINDIYR